MTAALAVKKVMDREKLPGTLMLWPGVAEEALGTKAQFVRAGVFKDVDAVLFLHVGSDLGTSWGEGGGSGMVSVEYLFTGSSSHAGGGAVAGKSALDAVELMDIAWNFKREHLRTQQRSHYVITNGGDQPNVVPPDASVWYYFRETDYDHIKEMWDLGDTMAKAAAMMTGTTVDSRVLGSAWPQHGNRPIAEAMYENIQAVGMPQWSEADQQFARALQRAHGQDERGLTTEVVADAERPRIDSAEASRPAAHPTTSATSCGACRRSRCASPRTSPARPAITGPAPSRWRRRSRTRVRRRAPKVDAMTIARSADAARAAQCVRRTTSRTCSRRRKKYKPLLRPKTSRRSG